MLRERGNPETSWRVAMLLAMAWTRPRTFGAPFVIDRRALNRLLALRLTENQLRGAIKTLVAIGFLVKAGEGSSIASASATARRSTSSIRISRPCSGLASSGAEDEFANHPQPAYGRSEKD